MYSLPMSILNSVGAGFYFYFLELLGIELRTVCMLVKYSTTASLPPGVYSLISNWL